MHRGVGLWLVPFRLPPRMCFQSVEGLVSPVLNRLLLFLISPLQFLVLQAMAISSVSQMGVLSAGALRDILSSDVQVSFGPSVFLAATSSPIPWMLLDVRPSHSSSTPALPVAPCSPVSSSSVPSPTPLLDFPLLGSSRTGDSFPLFHILCSSSSLSLGQLNPLALYLSMALMCWAFHSPIFKKKKSCVMVPFLLRPPLSL